MEIINFENYNAEFFQDKNGFREIQNDFQYQLFYKHLLIINLEYDPWTGHWILDSSAPKIHKELHFGSLDKQEALNAAFRIYHKHIKMENWLLSLESLRFGLMILYGLLMLLEVPGNFLPIIQCKCLVCVILAISCLFIGILEFKKNRSYKLNFFGAAMWVCTFCMNMLRL